MIKFPSINQYRNVIKTVTNRAQWVGKDESGEPIFNRSAKQPTLKFRGTVKLHGTNAAVVIDAKTKEMEFQSRERTLTLQEDNAGFALYMSSKKNTLSDIADAIINWVHPNWLGTPLTVVIFGEWCGGSIQKSVALNQLPKMFCIFAVKFIYGYDADGEEHTSSWININELKHIESPEDNIHNVLKFGSWEIDIDFNNAQLVQNKIIDITIAVENECPAGKFFGVSGIGEGVVWAPVDSNWSSSDYWFKVKGEAHSLKSKVRTLAPVDVEAIESLNEFVDQFVSENRLQQGLDKLREKGIPFEMKSMGDFIRWVYDDIIKEEADTIIESQLDPKKLGGPIANRARPWFINKYNEL